MDAGVVAALVESFQDDADGEGLKSRELILGLLRHTAEPFSRHQFTPGHITCTGLVMNPARNRILLVHHRRLDRWLLPGGHVEAEDESIEHTARREVIEETGADLRDGGLLIGVDVHGIPARRAEPYYLHHDLIFVFETRSETLVRSDEVRAVAWCGFDELDGYVLPVNIRRATLRAKSCFRQP